MTMVSTKNKRWLIFGTVWIALLGVFTLLAKVSDRPAGWADITPGFEVPEITFKRLSADEPLDAGKLDGFAQELKSHPEYRLVIEPRAAGDTEEDRQLAAARAEFVKKRLIELGLGDLILSNTPPNYSAQGAKGVTFKVKQWRK